MKVLTIFASIFIPLTFIAGIYGTNFDYLPELHYPYGYYIMWAVMLTVAGVMLIFFKRKKMVLIIFHLFNSVYLQKNQNTFNIK